MIVVGLVGRMAAGKSTVARMFAARGAHVVDADAIAHAVLEEPEARTAIRARFGDDAFGADGRVSRAALARLVFGPEPAHARALADLEAIVHPRVAVRIEAELASLRGARAPVGGEPVVVLDVPLLVQSGWAARCDRLVFVSCAEPIRRERLRARGVPADQQAARDGAWERGGDPLSAAAGKPRDHVDGSGDLAYTSSQVERIWNDVRRP